MLPVFLLRAFLICLAILSLTTLLLIFPLASHATSMPKSTNADELAALEQAETHMDRLNEFLNQLAFTQSQIDSLASLNDLRQKYINVSALVHETLAQAESCIEQLHLALNESLKAQKKLEVANRKAINALKAVATAKDRRIALALQTADTKSSHRRLAERTLASSFSQLQDMLGQCGLHLDAVEGYVNSQYAFATQFGQTTAKLQSTLQLIRTAVAHSNGMIESGAVTAPITVAKLPPGVAIQALSDRLTELRVPRPSRGDAADLLKSLQTPPYHLPEINQMLAQKEDASAYLDGTLASFGRECNTFPCTLFKAEKQDLKQELIDAQRQLMLIKERMNDLRDSSKSWLMTQNKYLSQQQLWYQRLEAPLESALSEAQSATQLASQHFEVVHARVSAAFTAAENKWIRQYELVYGEPPYSKDGGEVQAAETRLPDNFNEYSESQLPDIHAHAYEAFSEIGKESEGFGAYTYVLLRSKRDLATPSVKAKYLQLLRTLDTTTIHANEVESEFKITTNLFCLPGERASHDPSLYIDYDASLGNQLKFRATNGVLNRSRIKTVLTESPGPFLLTLPTRIKDSDSRAPLLFADLSAYSEKVITDLVVSYMTGLIDEFPDKQASWKPPVAQRVALFMISLATGTGQIVANAFPTAAAEPSSD